jgi:hypothetical protein
VVRSQANAFIDVGLSPLLPDCFQVRIGVKHRSLLSAADKKEKAKGTCENKGFCEWKQYLNPLLLDPQKDGLVNTHDCMLVAPTHENPPPSPFAKGGSWRKWRAKEVSPLSKRGTGGISQMHFLGFLRDHQ